MQCFRIVFVFQNYPCKFTYGAMERSCSHPKCSKQVIVSTSLERIENRSLDCETKFVASDMARD